MRIAKYKLYKRTSDNAIVLSTEDLPGVEIWEKNKYVGRQAKAEAIKRLTGKVLPKEWSTQEVNNYVGQLYNTKDWGKYREILRDVASERIKIEENYIFQYTLEVQFKDGFALSLDDRNVMQAVAAIATGQPLKNKIQDMAMYIVGVKKIAEGA